ncbi:hypothetical protein BJ741DRAFT_714371 [Chytriomyces cf. hyalinus JEL632]|nr:hypothetical protein BJ741DRAFT_714371 [Chytriomyces cf. hyalinus JEL632]
MDHYTESIASSHMQDDEMEAAVHYTSVSDRRGKHCSHCDSIDPHNKPAIHIPHRMALFTGVVLFYIILTLVAAGSVSEPSENPHSQTSSQDVRNQLPFSPPEEAPPRNTLLACPKWETFNVKAQGDKDFSRNCRVVAAKVGGFEVKLCESMRECGQGYFLLKRLDKAHCDKAMARSISWDYEFDAWMKKEVGPTFRIRVPATTMVL